jgi:hypothetical protein
MMVRAHRAAQHHLLIPRACGWCRCASGASVTAFGQVGEPVVLFGISQQAFFGLGVERFLGRCARIFGTLSPILWIVNVIRNRHSHRHCLPVRRGRSGCSFQFGRTSICRPRAPHLAHTALRLEHDSRGFGLNRSGGFGLNAPQ